MKWNENSQRFRDLIGREELSPPRDRVVALLKEMDEAGQRRMARELQFSFAKRSLKRWPEMIFMKTLREYLQQATHDLDIRQRLYLALIQSILPLLGDEEEALESFMGRHQALIKQYGVWHFYWAFYFHPARMFENELWEGLKPEVEEKCMKLEHSTEVMDARANLMKVVVRSSVSATAQVTDEQSRRIAVEKMLATERERRIQMEHEVSQYQRLLREKQSEGSELGCQLQELQQYAETLVAEGQAIQQQIEQERRERHEALRRVMSEKTSLTEQLQLKRQELKQQEQETEQYELKLAELRSSYDRMRAEAMEREEILHDTGRLLRKLSELLHAEIEQIAIALNMKEQESPEVRTALRRQLRATVDLLDTMELYTHKAITVPDGQSVLNGVSIAETIRNIEDTPRAEVCAVSEAVDQIAEQAGEEVIHIGTFYRREHGGYIQLENQETFNITESMVYKHDLQHQAEVQCRPRTHQSGGIYYDIELLFQGDDAVSPIRQLDGYVELGEHHTWYCVEMNQPSHRYPLHRRDVEIQKPLNGMPCTFNLSEDSDFARLSRLYRSFSRDEKQSAKEVQPAKSADDRHSLSRGVEKPETEPFLQGCSIAIIGGQRKWFEEVIMETGAALVHDTGDSPERMKAALRRASALFMLLTSTSHRSTIEGIEIAKQYDIPHFTIQGSKSNLRKLLRDHRHQIRKDAKI